VIEIEGQPMKGPAIEVEMQVGIRVVSDRNDSMNPGAWRPLKLVRFDRLSNLRTNSARDDLRFGSAVTIGQVNLLGKKIDGHAFGAESLSSALKLGVSQEQETVAKLESGLEPVHLFAAKSEVRRRLAGLLRAKGQAIEIETCSGGICDRSRKGRAANRIGPGRADEERVCRRPLEAELQHILHAGSEAREAVGIAGAGGQRGPITAGSQQTPVGQRRALAKVHWGGVIEVAAHVLEQRVRLNAVALRVVSKAIGTYPFGRETGVGEIGQRDAETLETIGRRHSAEGQLERSRKRVAHGQLRRNGVVGGEVGDAHYGRASKSKTHGIGGSSQRRAC